MKQETKDKLKNDKKLDKMAKELSEYFEKKYEVNRFEVYGALFFMMLAMINETENKQSRKDAIRQFSKEVKEGLYD